MVQLNAKLEKLEERFAFGEIDREIIEKVGSRLKEEIKAINDEVNRPGIELSNPASLIDHSLEIISNLSDFWVSSDYDDKRKLQEVVFPGGVQFDKQSNNYRTREVNAILQLTHSISNDLEGNKNGQIKKISDLPGLVAPAGIEPASSESESEILSIEIRSLDWLSVTGYQGRSAIQTTLCFLKSLPSAALIHQQATEYAGFAALPDDQDAKITESCRVKNLKTAISASGNRLREPQFR